jgi:hypothetical protein
MLRTVDFDDQPNRRREEIHDVVANGFLPVKSDSGDLVSSDPTP